MDGSVTGGDTNDGEPDNGEFGELDDDGENDEFPKPLRGIIRGN